MFMHMRPIGDDRRATVSSGTDECIDLQSRSLEVNENHTTLGAIWNGFQGQFPGAGDLQVAATGVKGAPYAAAEEQVG